MNPVVGFPSGILGGKSATPAERAKSVTEIQSMYKAKFEGQLRRIAQQWAKAAGNTQEAAQAAQAKQTEAASETGNSSAITGAVNDELDRDAFLQLLVMEMQNQDPLEPMDNADMIAQLAQFSSLEQMNSLNESFEAMAGQFEVFAGNLDQLNFISAQNMLGQYVEGLSAEGAVVSGRVDTVHLEGSIVQLGVDGSLIPMSGVLSISDEAPETTGADGAGTAGESKRS